jgi:hypothetical protein
LKKYTPLLIFEEFWEELGMLKISLCWDICPLSFIFLFLSLFFRAPTPLFGYMDRGSSKRDTWSFIALQKGLAMDEGKFLMLTPSVGVEQF